MKLRVRSGRRESVSLRLGKRATRSPAGLPPRGMKGAAPGLPAGLGVALTHLRKVETLHLTGNSMWALLRPRIACGHPRALRIAAGLTRCG
jgi:hypothetical protein